MKKKDLFLVIFVISIIMTLTSCSSKTYLIQANNESFEQLTKITDIGKPCFGPVGGDYNENLFFAVLDDGGYINIYRKSNATLPAIYQKTFGNGLYLWPDYSKINDKLVFQNYNGTSFNIFTLNATSKGKAITSITTTTENNYNPSWSPDGKKIIFEKGSAPKDYFKTKRANKRAVRYSKNVLSNQLWIKDLETGELKMIGVGSFPKYSPDNKYIAYVKYELDKKDIVGTIWIMSSDGETNIKLTNVNTGYATRPSWDPTSNTIIFQLTKRDKTDSDLYSIEISGENLKQYTTNKSNDFAPYWTEDGFIYFSSDRGSEKGKYQIWRFKVN